MFPNINDRSQTVTFLPRGASASALQPYDVPIGAIALNIICIGGGGGGGNGFGAAAGAARGGGGGGGSGSLSRIWIPTAVLPRRLYVRPGIGGAATAAGQASYVSVAFSGVAADLIITTNGGNAGGTGTGAAVGAAGTGGAIVAGTSCAYSALGHFVSIAGVNGGAGGAVAGAAGAAVTFGGGGLPLSGGGGGAGSTSADFAGGAVTGAGRVLTVPGGLAGANPGNLGTTIWKPLTFTGGSGAGSSNTVAGARGGQGSFGCGGGGGGAGVTTGGTGGAGGSGIVIITAIYT